MTTMFRFDLIETGLDQELDPGRLWNKKRPGQAKASHGHFTFCL